MRLSRQWSLAFVMAFASVGTAFAHALPKTETPAAGTTLGTAPAEVSILFSEAVDPHFSGIVVRNAEGQRVDDGGVRFDPGNAARLAVGLKPPVAAGSYSVLWHALSPDGHRTQGSYHFDVAP